MKKAFIVLITIVFSVGLIVLYELTLHSLPNEYKYKNEYLIKNATSLTTLVLGNSHAYYGIDPKFFDQKAFNAAYVSQSLNYDFAIFNKYKFDNLKNVVINISYFSLFSQIGKGSEDGRAINYELYYNINTGSRRNVLEMFTNKPFYISFQRLGRGRDNLSCDSNGHFVSSASVLNNDELMKSATVTAKRHNSFINYDVYDENLSIIETILMKNPSVNFYFVITPYNIAYYSQINDTAKDKVTSTFLILRKQYNNCYFYDFSTATQFTNNDFHDADHLNKSGSEKFSVLLNTIIQTNDSNRI